MKRRPREAGLTLMELQVVSLILVSMTFILWGTFRYQSRTLTRETGRGATQADMRIWAARMMLDMRNAGYDPLGTIFTSASPAVTTATPTDFEFKLDANRNGAIDTSDPKEYRGYRLSGSSLQLRQAGNWRTVVTGVTGLSFTYYDVRGTQVNASSPYTSYSDIAQVRFTITAQATDASTSFTESGAAMIRNPA